ncbi:mucin-3B [Echinops telfairi]|uniref:Mucin-3B n=1 Tax=Echinops telfairi TaxID=9371 RepID=A0ABM0ZR59_ECHTE|nr:mucin-3B [Echinops telfairi]
MVPGTTPTISVSTSIRASTSGSQRSTSSEATSPIHDFTTKPSVSLPSDMTTSSKWTSPTLPVDKTSTTSVATTRAPTTQTTPVPTSTTTQSRVTTTPGCTCDNGGSWDQGRCLCPSGFSGDRCQFQDNKCQNGGRWDGLKCLCPSTFSGPLCESPAEQVDLDTVDAQVDMEVSVDQPFSPELNDNTSQVYKEFNATFQNQIRKVYQNVPGFHGVEILSLRSGSIVVDYVVLLKLPFSVHLESEYEKVKTALKEELQNASQQETNCSSHQTLCFKPDSIKVTNNSLEELTPQAICRRVVAKGYEDFYFPLVEENQLRCVTNCTVGVEGAFDCHQGQCVLERSGPECRCFSTDTLWISGSRCQVAIHWRALVGGLAGAAALLLLLLLGLGLLVARSRRHKRSWTEDREWTESWDADTFGTFSNLDLDDPEPARPENMKVTLENVDTSMKVQIQRPHVSSSI